MRRWCFFMVLIAILVTLASCRGARDSKAVNRVKANVNLLNDVGEEWQKLHPCIIDSVILFKDGKEVVRYDTLDISHTDTLYNVETKVKTVTLYRDVVKTIVKHDTSVIYTVDQRALQLARDEANILKGQNAQLNQTLKETKSTSNKKTWWMIGEGLAILALIFFYIKKK